MSNPLPESEPAASSSQSALLAVSQGSLDNNSEESLVRKFGVEGAAADEVLGYDDDNGNEEPESDELDTLILEDEDEPNSVIDNIESDLDDQMQSGPLPGKIYSQFQTQIRLEETQRAEKNR